MTSQACSAAANVLNHQCVADAEHVEQTAPLGAFGQAGGRARDAVTGQNMVEPEASGLGLRPAGLP
jgi:hypothetical protein